jgi:mRNA-degrading endonuclease RelE of RelBE toxin-antitoxin system
MTPAFRVLVTPRFERLFRKLDKRHSDLSNTCEMAISILHADPHNRGRKHAIKKLEGVKPGEGQYRLRLGCWRFRYDVLGQDVILHYCGLRREDTYR